MKRIKALVFYAPKINKGEFAKEAQAFAACHGIPTVDLIPIGTVQPLMLRRWKVMRELRKREGQHYDAIVFFCHGKKNYIQLGFKRKSIKALADRIRRMAKHRVSVVLYCCSCAARGGIAELLRDELMVSHECRVIGHTNRGHTTRNPHVRVYYIDGLHGYVRSHYFAALFRDKPYWDRWDRYLDADIDFRFRFPFMWLSEIVSEIGEKAW